MGLEDYFKIPKDREAYYCSNYMPVQVTTKLRKEMTDIKKTPEEEKKKVPPEFKNNPCLQKNHHYNNKKDLARAPDMIPEQVHEFLLAENYQYHLKAIAVKEDYVKTIIKDASFEKATSGYWNVKFLPMVYPEVDDKAKKALDKRGFFCLAMFYADYLKLALEQMLMDEMMKRDYVQGRLEDMYTAHNRIRCMIQFSMAKMKLEPGIFNYKKSIREFRYREIASRTITNLRTLITLRSCYLFSVFVWRVLYIHRFDAK